MDLLSWTSGSLRQREGKQVCITSIDSREIEDGEVWHHSISLRPSVGGRY
uniref:Uncharacterized protein n=1 Tax=Arion vulgaris TaxID=1028688 RepID=A0A0B6ZXW7_9EUPU